MNYIKDNSTLNMKTKYWCYYIITLHKSQLMFNRVVLLLYVKCGPERIVVDAASRIVGVTIADWTSNVVIASAKNTTIRIAGLHCPLPAISCKVIYIF